MKRVVDCKLHSIAEVLWLWPSNFHCLDSVYCIQKTFFILKSDCNMALTRYFNLHRKNVFSDNLLTITWQNFDIFCSSGPAMVRIWVKLKLVKFQRYFSRCNFEKLIQILQSCCQLIFLIKILDKVKQHETNLVSIPQ